MQMLCDLVMSDYDAHENFIKHRVLPHVSEYALNVIINKHNMLHDYY